MNVSASFISFLDQAGPILVAMAALAWLTKRFLSPKKVGVEPEPFLEIEPC